MYTRVRRFTLYGSIILRKASEEILPTISRILIESIAEVDPDLRINHKIYRKVLLKLNRNLALIPYNKTWLPPVFPSTLWRTGYILKKLNDLIRKVTRSLLGLDATYFDFNEALRYKKWRSLLYDILLNQESLIYKLGYLKYEPIKKLVIEHLKSKQNHGEKLAHIISLELVLREIYKYID